MANLLCQHGYFFPVGECNKNLSVKDDSSLYRFQVNTPKKKKTFAPLSVRVCLLSGFFLTCQVLTLSRCCSNLSLENDLA